MFEQTGKPDKKMVKSRFPEPSVLIRPKAILGCYEEIPCDPCMTLCPFDAITIAPGINNIPVLDTDRCTGCGLCVTGCPGLAIMVAMIKGDKAIFKVPYEMPARVARGDVVDVLDGNGDVIALGLVTGVATNRSDTKTKLVTLEVDKNHLYDVSSFKVRP
jgi:Fe-S-cluster-containing hydrogenase component 2